MGVGSREGQDFRVTSGSLIPGSKSPPSPGRRQSRGRSEGLKFGCAVFAIPPDPQGRAGAVGQELGERPG